MLLHSSHPGSSSTALN